MGTLRHSFTWWQFRDKHKDPTNVLKAAKKIGYDAVELIFEEHWATVRDAGLQISSMAGHKSIQDGLNKKANHSRIEDELKQNIEKAKSNNIPVLICLSGNRYPEVSDEEAIGIVAEGLNRVKKDAEAKGITLCLELLNSKVDHKDYQCDHTPWGVAVMKQVNSPRVKLLYDIYHMQIMEGDLIRTIRDNIQYIGHFHTGGNPGRNDLDTEQEIYYPAVVRAIKNTNYDGYIAQEFHPKGELLPALEAALKICKV
jgi:hydroxypyruvate isomerase